MPKRRPLRGFTLVELLVVIGIIAALIGILLPVLSGVQSRGRDIKCQSNLRQIVQLFVAYASENKGRLPYTLFPYRDGSGVWNVDKPTNWDGSQTDSEFISWASVVSKMSRGKGATMEDGYYSSPFNAPFLKCPEAAMVENQLVTYVTNMAILADPFDDWRMGMTVPLTKSALLSGTFGHNALIWDCAVGANSDENVGYLGSADLDGQRFWRGATTPQWRYFQPHDPYGQIPGNPFGNNRPVQLSVGSSVWKNIDPGTDPPGIPYQGNLRFRHNKNTACNVGYGDGHVGQFTGKFNSDKTAKSHDALRKFFMPKWPSGIAPDPSQPF